MIRSRLSWATCTLCLIAAIASGPSAQSARSNAVPVASSSDELLAEVRAIRSDLAQAAGASIRTQLLVARLQLQEHRISFLAGQLQGARQALANHVAAQEGPAFRLKNYEDALSAASTIPSEEQRAIEQMLRRLKTQVAQAAQREAQLRQEENDLAGQLAAEQGRWLEFSDRLDALERSLPGTRQ